MPDLKNENRIFLESDGIKLIRIETSKEMYKEHMSLLLPLTIPLLAKFQKHCFMTDVYIQE